MKNEQKNDKKNYFQTRFGKFRTLTRIMRQKKVSYDFLKRNPQKTFSPCGTVEIKKNCKTQVAKSSFTEALLLATCNDRMRLIYFSTHSKAKRRSPEKNGVILGHCDWKRKKAFHHFIQKLRGAREPA